MSKTRLLTQPHECASTSFANGAAELEGRQRGANVRNAHCEKKDTVSDNNNLPSYN